jgi:uncharacterized ion transporter superfamily protein YfcC
MASNILFTDLFLYKYTNKVRQSQNKSSQSRIERFKREKSIHENKLAYGI